MSFTLISKVLDSIVGRLERATDPIDLHALAAACHCSRRRAVQEAYWRVRGPQQGPETPGMSNMVILG